MTQMKKEIQLSLFDHVDKIAAQQEAAEAERRAGLQDDLNCANARRKIISERVTKAEEAVVACGMKRGGVPFRLVALIAKIAGFGVLHRTREQLCKDRDIKCGLSGLKDAFTKLEQAGILLRSPDESPTYRGKKRINGVKLALNFTVIDSYLDDGETTSFGGDTTGVTHPATVPVTVGDTVGVTHPATVPVTVGDTLGAKNEKHSICIPLLPNSPILPKNPSTPPPPLGDARDDTKSNSEKTQKEEEINSLNCLIEKFKDRGVFTADRDVPTALSYVDSDHLERLLAFYDAHRNEFDSGALHKRLAKCRPRLAIEDCWPKPKPKIRRSIAELLRMTV